jgi:hypothetical protein
MVYSLAMEQCMEYIHAKLELVAGYDDMKGSFDLISLIKAMKGLVYQFEGQNYHPNAFFLSHKRFYSLYKTQEMTNAQFLEKFIT